MTNEQIISKIKGKDSEADFDEPYGGKFILGAGLYATVKYLGK